MRYDQSESFNLIKWLKLMKIKLYRTHKIIRLNMGQLILTNLALSFICQLIKE